jgi:hypothetical protein
LLTALFCRVFCLHKPTRRKNRDEKVIGRKKTLERMLSVWPADQTARFECLSHSDEITIEGFSPHKPTRRKTK